MTKSYRTPILGLAILSLAAYAFTSYGAEKTPAPLAAQAKITMDQARAKALKEFPGQIVSAELEREHGGSGLRYSFDIKKGNEWREVGVDAKTGRILENSKEAPNPKD